MTEFFQWLMIHSHLYCRKPIPNHVNLVYVSLATVSEQIDCAHRCIIFPTVFWIFSNHNRSSYYYAVIFLFYAYPESINFLLLLYCGLYPLITIRPSTSLKLIGNCSTSMYSLIIVFAYSVALSPKFWNH